jgi:hypothetical protein
MRRTPAEIRLELTGSPARHTNAGRIAIPIRLTRGSVSKETTLVITADQAEALDSRLQELLSGRSRAS